METNQNTVTGSTHDDEMYIREIPKPDADGREYETVVVQADDGNDDINARDMSFSNMLAYGGAGNDTINGSSQSDYLSGDEGNDRIYASSSDTVNGGLGNDRIFIAGRNVQASGGDGNDTITISSTVQIHARNVKIDGGDGEDTLIMDGYISRLNAQGIEKFLIGQQLYIDGAMLATLPTISGATHRHVYIGLTGQVDIDGHQFDPSMRGSLVGSRFDDVLDFSGSESSLALNGYKGNDLLKGNDLNNILDGGIGNDTIYGGGGDDKIYTDLTAGPALTRHDSNIAIAGAGNDKIHFSGIGINTIYGGTGEDTIVGDFSGQDHPYRGMLFGGDGDDVFRLNGSIRDITIIGGEGHDVLDFSGAIPERAIVDVESLHTSYIVASADHLNAFSTIVSPKATEIRMNLIGAKVLAPLSVHGSVSLQGSDEVNRVNLLHTDTNVGWQIDLGGGDDRCLGTQRDDIITGGKGNDVLDGGGGRDTFVLGDKDGQDTIRNFEVGVSGDVLNFAHSSRIQSISDFVNHLTDDGHLIYGGSDIDLGGTKTFIEDHWVVGNLSFHD